MHIEIKIKKQIFIAISKKVQLTLEECWYKIQTTVRFKYEL